MKFISLLSWVQNWRHVAAYLYLSICVFDFIIMPALTFHARPTDMLLIQLITPLPSSNQVPALHALTELQSWDPITLKDSGLFHISFGAILGVAAWTRGQEKIQNAVLNKVTPGDAS